MNAVLNSKTMMLNLFSVLPQNNFICKWLRQGPDNSLHVRIAPNVLRHSAIDGAAQNWFKLGNETIFAQDDFEMLAQHRAIEKLQCPPCCQASPNVDNAAVNAHQLCCHWQTCQHRVQCKSIASKAHWTTCIVTTLRCWRSSKLRQRWFGHELHHFSEAKRQTKRKQNKKIRNFNCKMRERANGLEAVETRSSLFWLVMEEKCADCPKKSVGEPHKTCVHPHGIPHEGILKNTWVSNTEDSRKIHDTSSTVADDTHISLANWSLVHLHLDLFTQHLLMKCPQPATGLPTASTFSTAESTAKFGQRWDPSDGSFVYMTFLQSILLLLIDNKEDSAYMPRA